MAEDFVPGVVLSLIIFLFFLSIVGLVSIVSFVADPSVSKRNLIKQCTEYNYYNLDNKTTLECYIKKEEKK